MSTVFQRTLKNDFTLSYPVHLNLLLALTKFFFKVIKSMKKIRCFSRISEISLDKFERIWSMKRRAKGRVKGEKVNGS